MTIKPRFNWRHQYDDDRDKKEGDLAALRCEDESLTVQSFAKDADLNEIARRFGISAIPIGPIDPALFRDTTQDPDLAQILQLQINAKNAFSSLPAKLRKRFHNNPAELWNFLQDHDNAEEAVRLGLLSTRHADATSPAAAQQQNTASGTAGNSTTGSPPKSPPDPPQKTSQNGT